LSINRDYRGRNLGVAILFSTFFVPKVGSVSSFKESMRGLDEDEMKFVSELSYLATPANMPTRMVHAD
jgi:hypothetical protein